MQHCAEKCQANSEKVCYDKVERKMAMNELRNIIMKDYSNTLGLVVYHGGEKTDEEYFEDFRADHSAHIFSATKSVVFQFPPLIFSGR